MKRGRALGRNTIFVLLAAAALAFSAASLPVTSQQFERYVREWSEPEGAFDSDNFISNETSYLHVIGDLHDRVRPGGVYLGVGPDQNLSYIAHTRPDLAIIVDIRRQNMLEHLLFKTLFDQAANRAEYLALLFSREKPVVAPDATFEAILKAVRGSPSGEPVFLRNFAAVKAIIGNKYGLKLSPEDFSKIDYVYRTFWQQNLDLRFSSIGRFNASNYPTYEQMLLETDRLGRQENYLSSEDLFQWL